MNREYVVLTIARMYQIKLRVEALGIQDPSLLTLRNEFCAIADVIHNLPREKHLEKDLANDAEYVAEILLYIEEHYQSFKNATIQQVIKKLAESWGITLNDNVLLFVRGKFAVRHYHFANPLKSEVFYNKYGVKISIQPRIVYIPAFYDNDLLFTSILFHEVGHMVEHTYSIGEYLYDMIVNLLNTNPRNKVLNNYFKEFSEKILSGKGPVESNILRSHINEYVADVFACQYLGEHALHFVAYKESDDRTAHRYDHPIFANRQKLVNKFADCMDSSTNYTDDNFIKKMIEIYQNTDGIPNLGKKYVDIDISPIYQGNLIAINSDEQLLSFFYHMWNVVLKGMQNNEHNCNRQVNSFSVNEYYSWLNQAIERSIRGYVG